MSDFAQFLGFLQFFFGSMPELVFPTFGTSCPLPEFVSADSDMLLSWLWHDASSDVRSPAAVAFGGLRTGPRRAMSFTARGINSNYSGEFRDSLKPRSIFCQGIGYRTDQSVDCDLSFRIGCG